MQSRLEHLDSSGTARSLENTQVPSGQNRGRTTNVIQSFAAEPEDLTKLVRSNIVATIALLLLLIGLVAYADYAPASGSGTSAPLPSTSPPGTGAFATMSGMLLFTLLTLVFAGGLGAVLCNLRGIFTYTSRDEDGQFPKMLLHSYQVRPFIGAITGLSVFFLAFFLSGFEAAATDTADWMSLDGRLIYVGLALLAGFASHEFMQKLKDLVDIVFNDAPRSRIEVTKVTERQKQDATTTEVTATSGGQQTATAPDSRSDTRVPTTTQKGSEPDGKAPGSSS